MSKITNDGLTRSGTGCFIAVPIWQQWASKCYGPKGYGPIVNQSADWLRRLTVSHCISH